MMAPRALEGTYGIPLTDVLLASILEETLVVWNAILAVDEATMISSVHGMRK